MPPKKQPEPVTIYPVEGHWFPGVPATENQTDAETAAALVATGAFTYEPPAKADEEEEQP